jgi:hypothetical protein
MSTITQKINDQLLDELGAYLNGQVDSKEFDLSRLEDKVLLLVYRYGRIGHGMVQKIRAELKQEIERRPELRTSRH